MTPPAIVNAGHAIDEVATPELLDGEDGTLFFVGHRHNDPLMRIYLAGHLVEAWGDEPAVAWRKAATAQLAWTWYRFREDDPSGDYAQVECGPTDPGAAALVRVELTP